MFLGDSHVWDNVTFLDDAGYSRYKDYNLTKIRKHLCNLLFLSAPSS